MTVKRIALLLLIAFYLFAGFNHFWHPEFYYPLIPPYLQQWDDMLNIIAGMAEMLLGVLLFFRMSRKFAAYGIILMLLAFIPAHIYFIEAKGCLSDSLCVPLWVAWARLVVVHPILIAWAWWVRKPTPGF